MNNIIILGSTGSVGKQALEVLRAHSGAYKVVGIVARGMKYLINRLNKRI